LGVRVMQLTYNYRAQAGDGCCEPENAGLSRYESEFLAGTFCGHSPSSGATEPAAVSENGQLT